MKINNLRCRHCNLELGGKFYEHICPVKMKIKWGVGNTRKAKFERMELLKLKLKPLIKPIPKLKIRK